MENAKNAGNVRNLHLLIRSTGPRKPLVNEIIRDQIGLLICSRAECLDFSAQYSEQQFSWPPATSNPESWPSKERWTVNMEPPSVSEVPECISLIKRHPAACLDDFPSALFKDDDGLLSQCLSSPFGSIWKKEQPTYLSCSAGVGTMDANRWIQLHKEFDAYYSEFERLLSECARPKNSADELVQLHAGFLIHDDIIDNSPTRRNRTSWFLMQKQAGRGLIAVNDGLHLILTTKFLLHRLFVRNGTTAVGYLKLLQLFDEVSYRTCWGESLDSHYSRTAPNDNTTELLPLDSFTRSNFNEICTWKTGFYTFYLPVACGIAIAGTTDEASYSAASHILLKLGRYFQAQQNYGRRDPVAQSAVREVYEQLRLRQIFADYEAQMRTEIMGDITDWTLPDACVTRHAQHLFCDLVDLLFRRAK
ncbi:hypothetical protein T265_05166 [Opisthorchis viverrini]|uniref:Polyprenyl synthetase n=1 Tax=Opisthorchis viverrini TaxID=6198 RepID=A0A074ZX06_OPIVI|nr:hypothetical protein T265_05166 [Opisthorchis viverrini]KER27885.1 hypothetical protein T265_05166 [Opisthorchis viverrini]